MPKSELASIEFKQLKNCLPGVIKGINWTDRSISPFLLLLNTVRVCRVVVLLHEGFCRKAQYYCDCRGPFLVPSLNLTQILLLSGKKQWKYFITFRACFKLNFNIYHRWINNKFGKTKVEEWESNIHCHFHKQCRL